MTKHQWRLLSSLNKNASELCRQVLADRDTLGVTNHVIGSSTVLDFAVVRSGTIAAGIELAKICLSGLGEVTVVPPKNEQLSLPCVQVTTDHPVESCIASQYAGWPVSRDDYFAMCSGPARMMRGKEELLAAYGLSCESKEAVGVFESNALPTEDVIRYFAQSCGVELNQVYICVARTASLPGAIQVVARSVETTMHKLHELGFDLSTVKNAIGSAPLPPIAGDDLTALGWTNDSILYGSSVNLWVDTEDDAIEKIGDKIPSSGSTDFGEPFLNIFNRNDKDFYKIDKLLFSPAHVVINNVRSGQTFCYGAIRSDILKSSFGLL